MKPMKKSNRLGVTCAIAMTLLAPAASYAQVESSEQDDATSTAVPEGSVSGMGDINLYPRRVIIDGRQRTAQVGLFNRTANDGSYEINITEMAMTPDGQLIALDQVSDPALADRVKSAAQMLRWSPKRLTLPGSESQTIRIMARPPADTPPGEYRAHFVAISRPDASTSGVSIDEVITGRQSTGIGVTIKPRFGISIPVIVRVGETTLDLKIDRPQFVKLQEGQLAVSLHLVRSGTRSAYGDLLVFRKGTSQPIAIARGIGVYPEIDSRSVTLPITLDADAKPLVSGEELQVRFIDDDFEPGATLATAKTFIP